MKLDRIETFRGQYAFLSNFFIEPDGSHVEGEYQARKSDPPCRSLEKSSPANARIQGRSLVLRPDWHQVRLGIMRELVEKKFRDHPALAQWLLDTGDTELVEGNWWGDTFWGRCKGVGENHLGRILMEVREQIRSRTGGLR